jgi:2-polyprenyl-3-methyl-5-hydroxy-6-metoxy-1,4-benzoquinol methylase
MSAELEIRRALRREPSEAELHYLLSSGDAQMFKMRLADFPEVHLDPSVRRAFEICQQRRLASEPLDVQTDANEEERDRLFAATERAWERLGTEEPYWSVVTSDAFKMNEIAETRSSFYETGRGQVNLYLQFLKRAGIHPKSISHLLEVGCGVGRMTHVFAQHFPRVTAVDISGAHIRLAQQAMAERGISNVGFFKVMTPRAYSDIQGYDALYSFIVLQHSPPPIMVHVLQTLLGNLRPGGLAFFQIPTFIEGYSFSIESYLAQTRSEMEMHCLPQKRIFQLLKGFEILEIINDGSGGDYRFECLRFLARKS